MRKRKNRKKGLWTLRKLSKVPVPGHRDFDDPLYTDWRKKIRKRDGAVCQMPNCGTKLRIQVHHIYPWAQYPTLRYNTNNGICLCRTCHQNIKGRELSYSAIFFGIAMQNEINYQKDKDADTD